MGAYVFAVLLGLIWGSFANVCIYRLPNDKSVVTPGSHCFACGTPIRWYDNVPLLAYLWLRGRCRACQAAFSPRYLLVEALTGALFGVACWFTLGTGGTFDTLEARYVHFAIDAAFIVVMIVIAFIDLDTKLILHTVTWPAIVVFYAASLYDHAWWEGLLGIAIGFVGPWLIGTLYMLIRKKEGLGLGDGIMLALVGALLGWRGVVMTLFLGSFVGSIIMGLAMLAKKHKAGDELPFAPFLAFGAVIALFGEPWITIGFRLYHLGG